MGSWRPSRPSWASPSPHRGCPDPYPPTRSANASPPNFAAEFQLRLSAVPLGPLESQVSRGRRCTPGPPGPCSRSLFEHVPSWAQHVGQSGIGLDLPARVLDVEPHPFTPRPGTTAELAFDRRRRHLHQPVSVSRSSWVITSVLNSSREPDVCCSGRRHSQVQPPAFPLCNEGCAAVASPLGLFTPRPRRTTDRQGCGASGSAFSRGERPHLAPLAAWALIARASLRVPRQGSQGQRGGAATPRTGHVLQRGRALGSPSIRGWRVEGRSGRQPRWAATSLREVGAGVPPKTRALGEAAAGAPGC